MTLRRFDDASLFLEHAGGFLTEHEAHHNLVLGLCASLRANPLLYGEPAYMATVDRSRPILAAVRTPPHKLVLSLCEDDGALETLAEDVRKLYPSLPGVTAPEREAAAFADIWRDLTGQCPAVVRRLHIYQLERVAEADRAPGVLCRADPPLRDLLITWIGGFYADALGEAPGPSDAAYVDRRLIEGSLYVWQAGGRPVSMAAYGGPTPNGIRVTAVYTPQELRGRGYATACVAALSRMLLAEGRRFCYLFTDASNPTSNHIYTTIGYEPVCDVTEYAFRAA